MLTANEAAAKLAREKKVPFVYRIHEAPPEEKVERLHEVLPKLGFECPQFNEFKPVHAGMILEQARGTDKFEAVNLMVLRSMAKAKYSTEPLGHFGLVLEDYAHFTSPIRRYPDLAIHRIITDILAGYGSEWLNKRYSGFAANSAERSSAAELRAVAIERECDGGIHEGAHRRELYRKDLGRYRIRILRGTSQYYRRAYPHQNSAGGRIRLFGTGLSYRKIQRSHLYPRHGGKGYLLGS